MWVRQHKGFATRTGKRLWAQATTASPDNNLRPSASPQRAPQAYTTPPRKPPCPVRSLHIPSRAQAPCYGITAQAPAWLRASTTHAHGRFSSTRHCVKTTCPCCSSCSERQTHLKQERPLPCFLVKLLGHAIAWPPNLDCLFDLHSPLRCWCCLLFLRLSRCTLCKVLLVTLALQKAQHSMAQRSTRDMVKTVH